jgi:hypothetical protein
MNWYLAKIVFRITCGEGDHTAQFDEQLRLISAEDSAMAFEKAFEMGNRESDHFMNLEKKLVQWTFINVAELYELKDMIDGAELYSRVQEYDDAATYTSNVHMKAQHIREQSRQHILEIA